VSEHLFSTICAECGVRFGVPMRFYEARREDKRSFWCPNGHSLSFKISRAQQLEAELSAARQESARLADELKAAGRAVQIAKRGLKAATVRRGRTLRAIENGRCPGCGELVPDMLAHRQQKHAKLECVA